MFSGLIKAVQDDDDDNNNNSKRNIMYLVIIKRRKGNIGLLRIMYTRYWHASINKNMILYRRLSSAYSRNTTPSIHTVKTYCPQFPTLNDAASACVSSIDKRH